MYNDRANTSRHLLDKYDRMLFDTVFRYQHPCTGLLPSTVDCSHAWVRDNVNCALALWGVALAHRNLADTEEERSMTHEREHRVVKCMRGLLTCMCWQRDKLERFKVSQSPSDALHAKFYVATGRPCVSDHQWGHLQIDAISIFLLALAQMTASGLQIVYTLDEVSLVQNLVFYVEMAYFTPDYGIWERGDKLNHGHAELNASSVGMAKAALEALREMDLYGANGGPASVIHVMSDAVSRCEAVLHSMLPRESLSKELDSALLTVIGFPAFAITSPHKIEETRTLITERLMGVYGCKRFLRDGYMTCREDRTRMHYEPHELRRFEHVECQWPLFFCYLCLDAHFRGDTHLSHEYIQMVERVMFTASSSCTCAVSASTSSLQHTDDTYLLVPEMYMLPEEVVEAETQAPGTQTRLATGRVPFFWAQSLYVLCKLLEASILQPSELDPLNRRFSSEKKPDVVVQVALVAENSHVQQVLATTEHIHTHTLHDTQSQLVRVHSATVLARLFSQLGRSSTLALSGRVSQDVGVLATSVLYQLHGTTHAFTPQCVDSERTFFASDPDFMVDILMNEINYLHSSWSNMLGRPLVTLVLRAKQLVNGGTTVPSVFMRFLRKLRTGYINGSRVIFSLRLDEFVNTSCISSLEFLNDHERGLCDQLQPGVRCLLEDSRGRVASIVSGALLCPAPGSAGDSARALLEAEQSRTDRSAHKYESMAQVYGPASLRAATQTHSPAVGDECHPFELTFIDAELSAVYGTMSLAQLVLKLDTLTDDCLQEEANILYHLATTYGIELMLDAASASCDGEAETLSTRLAGRTVQSVYESLYARACVKQKWCVVRHAAGVLGYQPVELAKCLTDLLVRQKQVTLGGHCTGGGEEYAIMNPLSGSHLERLLNVVCGHSRPITHVLIQEVIVYLSVFVRTEPHLFSEMLRLRVDLILYVAKSEIRRILHCSDRHAIAWFIDLSPFQMKRLLHLILDNREFDMNELLGVSARKYAPVTRDSCTETTTTGVDESQDQGALTTQSRDGVDPEEKEESEEDECDMNRQWLRRRRIDGALNRVPLGFYRRLHDFLSRTPGLDVLGRQLPHSLTEEMTPGEAKFALQVEGVLCDIAVPEYRQLIVEALTVLTLLTEHVIVLPTSTVRVEQIIDGACRLFLREQHVHNGAAMLCCAASISASTSSGAFSQSSASSLGEKPLVTSCRGANAICRHFYESAPSGKFGTMTYLMRALSSMLSSLYTDASAPQCNVS